ncbi:ATP-binding protein [Sphingomonas sp. Leaf412]|uniref:AAA family ATPase n=1 Tax=Sphingomonas sp. Leaf412 TaxID=1736370 RepID=UPI0006F4813C|nr:AAA family ATPase [Sphingomonas sp. Leaf412]KQT34854.1 ATP-binding protein [Sphingomonas sp. Leaf412]
MIEQLAISGYRSLRDIALPLGRLTIVTGANGTGKSSIYRALRLLGDVAQGRLVNSLAREGGLPSTLWAGPERISREMRAGDVPIQGIVRSGPVSLRLGFAGADLGYAIDLGLPSGGGAFALDPEIKVEAMWSGGALGRANLFAERRDRMVRVRSAATGEWKTGLTDLLPFDSMVTHSADREDGLELLLMRERMRGWRFYDNLRTDAGAPARRPQVLTYTPALADDGADLAAAIATIDAIGEADAFHDAIADAFPDSSIAPGDDGSVAMRQRGLLRPLRAGELSDGTLRYILLCAALLAPSRPELLILNEPESSLHPSLIDPLARLLATAARRCQIVVVSHSEALVDALASDRDARRFRLDKDCGETVVRGDVDPPYRWTWPTR